MSRVTLASVQIGRVAPLGPEMVPSGFVKSQVHEEVRVEALGIIGDEQADLRVHGGPEKAVYGYAASHYPRWAAEFPDGSSLFVPGGLGENLTIEGLEEKDICVGDVHRIGNSLLQVCQPRQPCFKLALRFSNNRLPKAMVKTGRSGWYYRVLQPGSFRAMDKIELVDRPQPGFAFSRLVAIVSGEGADIDEIRMMAAMPELASHLREAARREL